MFRLFIIANQSEQARKLSSGLVQSNFTCSVASDGEEVAEQVAEQAPDLVLIAMDGSPTSGIRTVIHSPSCRTTPLRDSMGPATRIIAEPI